MKKQYLVWKNPDCNGLNPDWIELCGRDFYQFIRLPENRIRRFIILNNRVCKDATTIVIEANEVMFKKWESEHNHEKYLDKYYAEAKVVSLDSLITNNEDICFADLMIDTNTDIEYDIIRLQRQSLLEDFFDELSAEETELLNMLYINNPGLSESRIAEQIGTPRQTLNNQKLKIREKLKNYLGRNGF